MFAYAVREEELSAVEPSRLVSAGRAAAPIFGIPIDLAPPADLLAMVSG